MCCYTATKHTIAILQTCAVFACSTVCACCTRLDYGLKQGLILLKRCWSQPSTQGLPAAAVENPAALAVAPGVNVLQKALILLLLLIDNQFITPTRPSLHTMLSTTTLLLLLDTMIQFLIPVLYYTISTSLTSLILLLLLVGEICRPFTLLPLTASHRRYSTSALSRILFL